MKDLTQAQLFEALNYDPETGVFTWLKPGSNRTRAGDRAGVIAQNGRRYISVGGEKYMAHRLAWLYVHGSWPKGDLRHKNGNYDDCSAENLEDISRSQNARRSNMFVTNTSGFRGVSPAKSGKWQAHITRNYKQVFLGYFSTPEEASAAYERAAATMEVARSDEDMARCADAVTVRRRLRVAWGKLKNIGVGTEWKTFDEFARTVSDVPPRHSVVAVDPDLPLGPLNFKCEPDLSTGFDLGTREGRVAYNRAHRAANPRVYRDRDLRKNFGIGADDYDAMLLAQGGGCAICGGNKGGFRNGKTMALHVDHCHDTGKVRGILCNDCNVAIGLLGEDIDVMRRAIAYVSEHKARDPLSWSTPQLEETVGHG